MTPRRIGWAKLLARIFAVDVTVCSECGARPQRLGQALPGESRGNFSTDC